MTGSRPVPPATRRPGLRGRPAQRRELCVWLGTLSSWRAGLVKRLVHEFGTVDGVLGQDAATLRRAIGAPGARSRPKPETVGSEGDARRRRAHQKRHSEEETRFAAELASEPRESLARSERGAHTAVIAWCDPLYPPALRQVTDAPLCVFVRAACAETEIAERLRRFCGAAPVAVVGTRSPSPYGREMATLLARDLVSQGVVVVSGSALGVDAAAHAGALAARDEAPIPTVAVLGCGADVAYPRQNAALLRDIEARGLVVSEFAWGVPARAWRFPARNRVIAGLSRGLVIVEGSERSGARITADFALEMGREVLAVPGEAGRRLTAAPHAYLRQGAALCESAADVVRQIATVELPGAEAPGGDLGAAAVREILEAGSDGGRLATVLAGLGAGAMTAEQVALRCELKVHETVALLSELEVDGLVQLLDGGVYRLKRV